MKAWKETVAAATTRLRLNGLSGLIASILILALAPPTAGAGGFTSPLAWGLLLAFALITAAVSLHLLLDAALFRLASTHVDETTGLSAIDDVLSRMGLRARGKGIAPLKSRLAGCNRLLWLQRAALLITVALYAILLLDKAN